MPTAVDTPISAAPTLYDIVTSAPFTAASTVSVPWTVGKYRRAEVHLRVDSGVANGYLSFLGLVGESYARTGYYFLNATLTAFAGALSPNSWVLSGIGNQVCDADADVSCAASTQKTYRMRSADQAGYQAILSGTCDNATDPVSGIKITFSGATSGWLEVLGYT